MLFMWKDYCPSALTSHNVRVLAVKHTKELLMVLNFEVDETK